MAVKHVHLYPNRGFHVKYRSMQKVKNRYKLKNICIDKGNSLALNGKLFIPVQFE